MADQPLPVSVHVPDELATGVYANFLAVWSSPHEFTLDFAANLPVTPEAARETGVPARVVARVKIPPTVVFDVLQAISDHLGKYEQEFGPVRRPAPRSDESA